MIYSPETAAEWLAGPVILFSVLGLVMLWVAGSSYRTFWSWNKQAAIRSNKPMTGLRLLSLLLALTMIYGPWLWVIMIGVPIQGYVVRLDPLIGAMLEWASFHPLAMVAVPLHAFIVILGSGGAFLVLVDIIKPQERQA